MKTKLTAEKIKFYLSKSAGKAIFDYKMIERGDKIAVGVSGGKDSLSLLNILEYRKRIVPFKYDIVAIHISMWDKKKQLDTLKKYLEENNFNYRIVKLKIKLNKDDKNCFWCAWNRRKALFLEADRMGCKKIALGHHLDDITESILMNMLFKGEISSMAAKQSLFKGKLTIIRPFAYVEERQIIKFAKAYKLPFWRCSCPNADFNKRILMRRFIGQVEKTCPEVKTNIYRSLQRVKKDYLL